MRTDPEDRYLLAMGWLLLDLDNDEERVQMIDRHNALPVIAALSEMLLSVLRHAADTEPREVVRRWQREHLQYLNTDAHHDSEG